ncbi:DoxX family membrane protein [Halobaculum sp. CBA1158]|uniref:DoxX family protein n=1 Tax=Halobaculum sp. CBA1158 TaxID=2904243 RepID=UPI001F38DA68|nr:DoxX family membrane protein [Halobaculum sp. CBA1158]UIP00779.1 DoxX family membrane protein [Halobaculum sp. CBA1158]
MSVDSGRLDRLKRPLLYVMGPIYVVAGVLHLLAPEPFARIVPRRLPKPRLLVYLSGLAEIALGIGVLIPRTRRVAAKGIALLLVAVFPANVNMAVSDAEPEGLPDWAGGIYRAATWARLPLQWVLIRWAWWYTTPMPDDRE